MGCSTASLKAGLQSIAQAMEDSKDELGRLDGELGDGDLGVTMTRGMNSIMEALDELPEDFGMALFTCAKCFTKVSASSYGTLLATGLMAAAKACKGRTEIEWHEVGGLTGLALEAMKNRGKGETGQKTVLDTMAALHAGLDGADSPEALADKANAAVRQALEEYKDKPVLLGRARMFGDKTVGQDDPGMFAMTLMVQALAANANAR